MMKKSIMGVATAMALLCAADASAVDCRGKVIDHQVIGSYFKVNVEGRYYAIAGAYNHDLASAMLSRTYPNTGFGLNVKLEFPTKSSCSSAGDDSTIPSRMTIIN
ncbi:MAG: hypothetical protein ACI8WB_004223 [Phenylobacterium sp.]|jgi:hypothetical protein